MKPILVRRMQSFIRIMKLRDRTWGRILISRIKSNRFARSVLLPNREKSEPDLRRFKRFFEKYEFKEICGYAEDPQKLAQELRIKLSEVEKYESILKRSGFHFRQNINSGTNFRISFHHDYFPNSTTVKLIKENGKIEIVCHQSILDPANFGNLFFRLLTVIKNYPVGVANIFSHSKEVDGSNFFNLDLGDGGVDYWMEIKKESHLYAFARLNNFVNVGLIPDPYTLHDLESNVSYDQYVNKDDAKREYASRKRAIFWRGSTTGGPPENDVFKNARVLFCFESLRYPSKVDAKISFVCQFLDNERCRVEIEGLGILGSPVLEAEFGEYQAFIDLDGNSSGWGTFRKYLRMIHVIKPSSDYSMFYHIGQSDETFTKIKDTAELFRILDHNAEFPDKFDIAWRGYNFALSVRDKIDSGEATVFPVDAGH